MRRFLFSIPFVLLVLVGLVAGLIVSNLYTYHRLTDEAPIARLQFEPMAPRQYAVELLTGDFCKPQRFTLYGDQWRIDARFLKWKPLANLLGLDAMYRLERLSGRYRDTAAENREPHQAWDIGLKPRVDLLDYVNRDWKYWSPVDTYFGSSVYEDIDPAYRYTVYRGQSGLLVRKEPLAPAHYENGELVIHIDRDCRRAAE